MRPRAPSDPEIPDLEAGPRPAALSRAAAANVPPATDFEAELERSPSLPPEPANWVSDWAEYSGTEPPRSASTPPPRTSGFVRVQVARTESVRADPVPEGQRLPAAAATGLGSALGPGLLLVGASVLLTLVDQRTLPSPSLASAFDPRPPTWIAGVLCLAGLGFLVRGLWRFAEARSN